jgi:prepilin-type N-terminal cleavage/methylation domain-containing protein
MIRSLRSDSGFTLVEMMIAALITSVIMGVAFSTFENALSLNDSVLNLTDSSQNLRAGTNILVRDLMQAGRNLPIGGISIPSGDGAIGIRRPSPPNQSYMFDNTTATALQSITTGASKGPVVDGRTTDIVTILVMDPYLAPLALSPSTASGTVPKLNATGSAFDVGTSTTWLEGDPLHEIPGVKPGDLMFFLGPGGTSTLQTVTRIDTSNVYFDEGDAFNFNQPGAEAGSITQMLAAMGSPATGTVQVARIYMYSYWVEVVIGVPRLMRALIVHTPVALAGIVEDLELSYDLVDGIVNPVDVADLPFTSQSGDTFNSSQIRKVNVHVGVRSEQKSRKTDDYLRSHVTTVVAVRNLAWVDHYK